MLKKLSLLTTALIAFGSAGMVSAAPKILKIEHYQTARPDQPAQAGALHLQQCVEAKTDGSIKVQIYPAGQLGNATQAMEALKLGSLEMGIIHDGGISSMYRPFDIFAMPYLFPDHKTAYAVLDGPFGKEFADQMLKKTGIRLLAYADNGIRHFTNSKHPIKSPEDMKGLKIRVQPAPVFIKLVQSLGASASAIDWAELPAALAQGTVDGEENSATNIIDASLYQSQKYATLDGHVYSLHAYLISNVFWKSLTDKEKDAVQTCTTEARDIHRKMTAAMDDNAEAALTKVGMQVYVPTKAQIEAFREATQPAVKAYLDSEVDPKLVDDLLKAVKTAEAAGN